MLLKVNPKQTDVINCMPDELIIYKMAEQLELQEIIEYLSVLQSCNERLAQLLIKELS